MVRPSRLPKRLGHRTAGGTPAPQTWRRAEMVKLSMSNFGVRSGHRQRRVPGPHSKSARAPPLSHSTRQLAKWDNRNFYFVPKAMLLRHLRRSLGGQAFFPFLPSPWGEGQGVRAGSFLPSPSGEGPGVRAGSPPSSFRLPPSPFPLPPFSLSPFLPFSLSPFLPFPLSPLLPFPLTPPRRRAWATRCHSPVRSRPGPGRIDDPRCTPCPRPPGRRRPEGPASPGR